MEDARLYINGRFTAASSAQVFDVINPSDESVVGRAAQATGDDVARAVSSAGAAFDETRWAQDAVLRRDCLQQLQAGLRKEAENLKLVQRAEAGTCVSMTSIIDLTIDEITYSIDMIESFNWCYELPPYTMFGLRSNRLVRHEPRGVVAAITAWNSPIVLNLWKTVPALATGNTVVLKPAPETPLVAALLARVIDEETEIPPGVFNLITSSDNAIGGDALTGNPGVDMIHFTGSTRVGQRIAERAASGFRKVVLELGGKSANLLLDDADLDIAVPYSVGICMRSSGQGCTLGTRMIVHESLYDETVERLRAVVSDTPWGDPADPTTMVGPIIRADQVTRMDGLVKRAVGEGARVLAGGRPGNRGKGFWYLPTLVVDVEENSELAQTEVFGPVLSVLKYSGSDQEAVRIANNSRYGLSGYVQTSDVDRGTAVARRLKTGSVNVNLSVHNAPDTPFGGYRMSGVGREHGLEGWLEFLQTKAIATPAP